MKDSFKEFLQSTKQVSISDLQDPQLFDYMQKNHPRFFALVEKFGSPLETVSIQKEGTNISNSTAKVTLISEVPATQGKTLEKKLLLSMTVAALKNVCAKLFQVETLRVSLVYKEDGYENEFLFDEDQRQLSFFSVKDGGRIYVRET